MNFINARRITYLDFIIINVQYYCLYCIEMRNNLNTCIFARVLAAEKLLVILKPL